MSQLKENTAVLYQEVKHTTHIIFNWCTTQKELKHLDFIFITNKLRFLSATKKYINTYIYQVNVSLLDILFRTR